MADDENLHLFEYLSKRALEAYSVCHFVPANTHLACMQSDTCKDYADGIAPLSVFCLWTITSHSWFLIQLKVKMTSILLKF